MRRHVIETVIGAVVIAVAVLFFVFAYQAADLDQVEGYSVTARFDRIDGITPGSDVRISGVRIGSVTTIDLDPVTYLAVVQMSIRPGIELPLDTVAVIASESLLGGRYMALEPGAEFDMIEPGGLIEFTQSTPGIEQLLGQVIFSLQNNDGGN